MRGNRQEGAVWGGVWGAVMILVGLIYLLDHAGVVNASHVWRYWPALIVIVGVIHLTQKRYPVGIFLVALGSLYLLQSIGFMMFRWVDLWPIALIGAGIMFLYGAIKGRGCSNREFRTTPSDPNATLNEVAVFAGVEKRVSGADFRGGEVKCIFGGVQLDLRHAQIQGDSAVIGANIMFGALELRVPETWRVISYVQGVFGGYSEDRNPVLPDPTSGIAQKTLILRGSCVFGAVELKD